MDLLNSLGEMINSITHATGEKVKEISEVSKLNADTKKNEDLIKELKQIIGEYVINNGLLTDVELVSASVSRIKEAQEAIEINKVKIEEIRAMVTEKFNEVNRATSQAGSAFTEAVKDVGKKAGDVFNKATTKTAEKQYNSDIVEDVTEFAEEVKDDAAEFAEEVKKEAKEAAEEAKNFADEVKKETGDFAKEVKNNAEEVTEEAKDLAGEFVGNAAEKVEEAADAVKDKAVEIQEEAEK